MAKHGIVLITRSENYRTTSALSRAQIGRN